MCRHSSFEEELGDVPMDLTEEERGDVPMDLAGEAGIELWINEKTRCPIILRPVDILVSMPSVHSQELG